MWWGQRGEIKPKETQRFSVEVADPRGCTYIVEHDVDEARRPKFIYPVVNECCHVDLGKLSHWTEESQDDFFVSSHCWSTFQCNGMEVEAPTFTQMEYVPDSYAAPCVSGRFYCPNNEFKEFYVNVPGTPIAISNGSKKCGCLWDSDYLNGDLDFPTNYPILGVFDCDGKDITIEEISLVINPECGAPEIIGQQSSLCLYDLKCDLGNNIQTLYDQYIPDALCFVETDCQGPNEAPAAATITIYGVCDQQPVCEKKYEVLPYKINGEGIPKSIFLDYRDDRNNLGWKCEDLPGSGKYKNLYIQLCLDESFLKRCSDSDPSCQEYIESRWCGPGFTDDPPISTFPEGGGTNGTETPSATAIYLFPNPTSGATTLQFTKDARESGYAITIVDVYGHPIYSNFLKDLGTLSTIKVVINATSNFISGVYFVKVTGQLYKEELVEKLIVQ